MSELHNPVIKDVSARGKSPETVIELLEEQVDIQRRAVRGQTVRVTTSTRSREEIVDVALTHERIEIERVAVGRVVDAVPEIREEGDCTIYPVIEEVVTVERHFVLKEEIRIKQVRSMEPHRETVQLREQIATVTRGRSLPADPAASGDASPIPPSSKKEIL